MLEQLPPIYDGKPCWKKLLSFVAIYWRSLVIVICPAVLVPFLIKYYQHSEVRCGFVILLIATFWVTEALPMAVTSLLPIALYPLLDVLSTEDSCKCYMNDTIFMFVGGLVLALAVENSNLHMRIALAIMNIVGCSHVRLLGGIVLVTTFISMWIPNTAAAAMMVPIIFAVLTELEEAGIGRVFDVVLDNSGNKDEVASKITRGYLLGVAYSANFGGTSTLVGSGTNLIFKGLFEKMYPYTKISFAEWMLWSTPQAYINSFITWVYLLIFYFGLFRPKSEAAQMSTVGNEGEAVAKRVMVQKYHDLGKMTFHEKAVSCMFVIVVVLWVTRKPGFVKGWHDLLIDQDGPDVIQDSMPVVLAIIIMFIIPKEPKFLHAFSNNANNRPTSASQGLITWEVMQAKIPWSLIFLLGGGFAISEGSSKSNLSKRIGHALAPLKTLPPYLILCLLCLFINTFNELTSNMGIANIILPVVAQLTHTVEINPLYLMIPTAVMCSYSFRLPAATPPNAIITMVGKMPVKHLMIGGCIPAIYSLIVVLIMFPTWGCYVYEIDLDAPMPDWARSFNGTVVE